MTSPIQIKYLADVPEHVPTIARWRYEEWGYLFPEKTLEVWEEEMQTHLNKSLPFYLVAMLDDTPVGVAALRVCDMEGKEHLRPWIGGIVVEKQHRNQGIGRLLIQKIQQSARERGFNKLFLFTLSNENYYQKLGWQTLEQTQHLGHDVVIMKTRT